MLLVRSPGGFVAEFLCATSAFSVSLWLLLPRSTVTTETQRMQSCTEKNLISDPTHLRNRLDERKSNFNNRAIANVLRERGWNLNTRSREG